MRVLVVHNRYSSRVPSGENLAVDDEVRWLREAGVDVERHEVSNDEIVAPGPVGRAVDGLEAVWSLSAARRFRRALDEHAPDLVHVHNLFPLLTASVPAAAAERGVPVVWTAHNFRLRCVAGTHFRAGRPCHDCRPGFRVPGVVHRCYAGSVAASALVGAATSVYRSSARRRGVIAVGISRSVADWLVAEAGFDRRAVRVKYNGVAPPPGAPVPADSAGQRRFIYAGRLSPEKGIAHLLDAWRRTTTDAELHVVGEGPMASDVRAAAATDPRIVPVGEVPAGAIAEQILAARAVVVPSMWDEPFGRVAAEAFSLGRPVVTTGRGALGEIVDGTTGWITGSDPAAMAAALDEAAASDDLVAAKGAAGRDRHAARFSPEATTAALLDIYRDATALVSRRTG
jgi:glycosyltransferase involved in cell wall biosynthesis